MPEEESANHVTYRQHVGVLKSQNSSDVPIIYRI